MFAGRCKFPGLVAVAVSVIFTSGCVTPLPAPTQVRIPKPIQGNSGRYMSPYTSDETVAPWVAAGMKARLGSAVGKTVGAIAGRELLKQIPFVGGVIGAKAGNEIGRRIAIKAAGGMEKIKEQSDLSFNSIDNMAVYMYAKFSAHPDYRDVYKLTSEIYPQLQKRYFPAIRTARIP